jgi:hypothetical protein
MAVDENVAHCIRCDRTIEWFKWATDDQPPTDATVWYSRGNYGSTVWDEFGPNSSRAEAAVCDSCFVWLRDNGRLAIRRD